MPARTTRARALRQILRDRRPELTQAGLPPTRPHPSPGVPLKGWAKPSAREAAILRRVAAGFLCVTYRDGRPASFTYGDGSPVEIDERGFNRLRRWLVADRDDADGSAHIYRARRP